MDAEEYGYIIVESCKFLNNTASKCGAGINVYEHGAVSLNNTVFKGEASNSKTKSFDWHLAEFVCMLCRQ